MDSIYQPTDPTLIDNQNKYWRTKANHEDVQQLYFDLLNLDLNKIQSDYVKRWQKQAALGFRTRELDRDDGKYPWVAIDTRYDNRESFRRTRRINLERCSLNGAQSIPFYYVGRLIRLATVRHRLVKIHKLALPIPEPADKARRIMEFEWKQVQSNWFSRYEEDKEKAANQRAFLAEKLIHSHGIVTRGGRFHEIINYKPGNLSYPHDVGRLLGCIDYFKLCWREFHEAEQSLSTVEEPVKVQSTTYLSSPNEVLLVGKYYPQLGNHLPVRTLPQLAAEWYSDLAILGSGRIDQFTEIPYESATNKAEFLACLGILLTESEKYSHLRGYGYRQHFAPSDLTPSKEVQLEASGNAALRAVRNWHTEASLPPVERFVHRACKIELWQNEQYQLTTLGLDDEDWRGIYDKLFISLRRALYHTDEIILRTAYTELSLLLPTIHTRWMPKLDEYTSEENVTNNSFSPSDLAYRLPYCEFVPLQPLSIVSTQRDVCFMAWLMTHINVKEWYVWQALILLAGRLRELEPPTPLSFQPPVPKPSLLPTISIPAQTIDTSDAQEPITPSIWQALLIGELSVAGFFAFLIKCGLLDSAGELTTLGRAVGPAKARKAPWAGTLQALMKAGLLEPNAALVCRVLADPAGRIGVSLNEGTLRDYSTKADSYLQVASKHLDELGFLRK